MWPLEGTVHVVRIIGLVFYENNGGSCGLSKIEFYAYKAQVFFQASLPVVSINFLISREEGKNERKKKIEKEREVSKAPVSVN